MQEVPNRVPRSREKEEDLEPVEEKKENMGNCGGLPDDLSYLPTCGRLICPGPRRPSVHLSGRHVKARYASGSISSLSDILCWGLRTFRSTERVMRLITSA